MELPFLASLHKYYTTIRTCFQLKGQNESSTRANPVHFVETWSSEKSANAEHVSASYTKHVGNAWTHRHVYIYIYITLHNYRIKAQQKTAGLDLLACNPAHFSWNHAGASAVAPLWAVAAKTPHDIGGTGKANWSFATVVSKSLLGAAVGIMNWQNHGNYPATCISSV